MLGMANTRVDPNKNVTDTTAQLREGRRAEQPYKRMRRFLGISLSRAQILKTIFLSPSPSSADGSERAAGHSFHANARQWPARALVNDDDLQTLTRTETAAPSKRKTQLGGTFR
jgi:hypothetical protein